MVFLSLKDVEFSRLHGAFAEAFSDYSVPMNLSEADLLELLTRRGFRPDLSVGVFDGDRIVAFTFNGFGTWNSRVAAYDSGTGVVPTHRGLKLASEMMQYADSALRGAGAETYILEVVESNDRAVRLYEKSGFSVTRRLQCFTFDRPEIESVCDDFEIRNEELFDLAPLQHYGDASPSWQNSVDSIARSRDRRVCVTARDGGEIAGFGVVFPERAELAQLAVASQHRRKGAGCAIIARARELAGRALRVLNIDCGNKTAIDFLTAVGSKPTVAQFEMERAL